MSKRIYKGARVIDPARNIDKVMDIGVENGVFADPATLKDAEVVDLAGYVLAPGFIDLHVHLRQPGKTDAETIHTGTLAAAAGGFTSIVAMPNTSPCADNPGTIHYIRTYAQAEGVVKVLPCGAITKGLEGQEMAGIGGLKAAGVVALSDDGKCVQNHELMRHVIEYSRTFKLPILDHCEDTVLASGGVMHEGHWSVFLGMKGMAAAAEELIVARDAILARTAGWRVHIQHVSTKGSLSIIRTAQKEGVQITAEATPHHISLTDVEIKKFDTNYKMNPPLRSEEDRLAVIEGLRDGTITVIATDHAPHTNTAKTVEFDYAPFGIIGLETAVQICLTELYHKQYLDLPALISKFTKGPADVLGMPTGTLENGRPADITILDPEKEGVVDADKFYSKSRNTPFNGYRYKGLAVGTIVDGKCVFSLLDSLKKE
ncbi:MAG TPA: dihydroorotase [Lentisphaeria bacterium]|nr:dihydroorotase [Lentisphaeria bacterium]HCG50933.1 dihydroorotase [Lentisphaeria bacterium]